MPSFISLYKKPSAHLRTSKRSTMCSSHVDQH